LEAPTMTFWNRHGRQAAFDTPAVTSFRNKMADGSSLAPQARALLLANRQMVLIPACSVACIATAAGALLAQALLLNAPVVSYVLVALFAVAAAFTAATAAAALVLATMAQLDDEPLTTGAALVRAWGFRARVVTRALVCVVEPGRSALGARVAQALFGGRWAATSVFVLPVMLVEGLGVRAAGTRSAALVRTGFDAGAGAGLGVAALFLPQALATGVLALVLVALTLVAGSWLAAFPFLLVAAAGLLAVGTAYTATTTVARVMLYHQLTRSPYDQPAGP